MKYTTFKLKLTIATDLKFQKIDFLAFDFWCFGGLPFLGAKKLSMFVKIKLETQINFFFQILNADWNNGQLSSRSKYRFGKKTHPIHVT